MISSAKTRMRFFGKSVASLVSCALVLNLLCGCSLDLRHVMVTEEENDNSDITTWEDAEDSEEVETWESVGIASWEEVDEVADPIYSAALFDDAITGLPEIEVAVLDFKSNGQYFEGDKVYELVGNKFDLNKLVGDVAVGTTVIVVCVVIEAVTAGSGTPIAIFFAGTAENAGAAKAAIDAAKAGTMFGGALGAVTSYMESDADWEQTLYGTLEGAADGYKWGAVVGAMSGGAESLLSSMPKGETRYFKEGTPQAKKYPEGVKFDKNGYARFEPYRINEVKLPKPTPERAASGKCLTGNYYKDAKLANKMCGYASTPEGYVWHHVEDMRTMILVPQEVHSLAFGGMHHTGGASLIRKLLAAAV